MTKREIQGALFQPLSAKSQKSILILDQDELYFKDPTKGHPENLDIESFQDRKHIHFTSGHYFIADEALTPEVAEQYLYLYQFVAPETKSKNNNSALRKTTAKTSRFLNSLENLNTKKIVLLVLIFFAIIIGFRYTWPHLSKPIVALIPTNVDKTIGENAYNTFKKQLFKKTELPKERIDAITKRAKDMARNANLKFTPDIHFHSSGMGANAVAFPGGPIVVTDDLVRMLKEDDLILAVIGHEYGHVEERHSMRQIVNIAGIAAIASLIFGADESLLEELASVAIISLRLKNQREHEHEADLFSIKLLQANNMDPLLSIRVMEKLTEYICERRNDRDRFKFTKKSKDKNKSDDSQTTQPPTETNLDKNKNDEELAKKLEDCKSSTSSWLSTHPSGAERLKALRAAIKKK